MEENIKGAGTQEEMADAAAAGETDLKQQRKERRKLKKLRKQAMKKENKAKNKKAYNKMLEKEKYKIKHEKESKKKYAELKNHIKRMIRTSIIQYAHKHSTYHTKKLIELDMKTKEQKKNLEMKLENIKVRKRRISNTLSSTSEDDTDEDDSPYEENESDDEESSEDSSDEERNEEVLSEKCLIELKDKKIQEKARLKHKAAKFENFEWYGDLVVGNMMGQRIYKSQGLTATPHNLSKALSVTVDNAALAKLYDFIDLDEHVKMDKKKKEKDIEKQKGDVIEAIIGELTQKLEQTRHPEEREMITIFLDKLYDCIYNLGNVTFYELQQLEASDIRDETPPREMQTIVPTRSPSITKSRKRNATITSKTPQQKRHNFKSPTKKRHKVVPASAIHRRLSSPKKKTKVLPQRSMQSPKKSKPLKRKSLSKDSQHPLTLNQPKKATTITKQNRKKEASSISPIHPYSYDEDIDYEFHCIGDNQTLTNLDELSDDEELSDTMQQGGKYNFPSVDNLYANMEGNPSSNQSYIHSTSPPPSRLPNRAKFLHTNRKSANSTTEHSTRPQSPMRHRPSAKVVHHPSRNPFNAQHGNIFYTSLNANQPEENESCIVS